MALERFQNPTTNSEIILRLFTYNSNNYRDLSSIEKVELFFHDPYEKTPENPQGLRLVQTISGGDVITDDEGQYHVVVTAEEPSYTIGKYTDRWTVTFEDTEPDGTIDNWFEIYPDLWYTTPIPVVYDFNFMFRPNRLRKGSKQYLLVDISPNVPTGSDLCRYYENLAIVADVSISIEQFCGPCVPEESDLRLVVDDELITFREKTMAYYQLDTEDMECGLYNVWFKLNMGTNVYLSDKMQLQIY